VLKGEGRQGRVDISKNVKKVMITTPYCTREVKGKKRVKILALNIKEVIYK
jgi:hypothetical protein